MQIYVFQQCPLCAVIESIQNASMVEKDSPHFVPVNCVLLSIISLLDEMQQTKGVLRPQLLPTL